MCLSSATVDCSKESEFQDDGLWVLTLNLVPAVSSSGKVQRSRMHITMSRARELEPSLTGVE